MDDLLGRETFNIDGEILAHEVHLWDVVADAGPDVLLLVLCFDRLMLWAAVWGWSVKGFEIEHLSCWFDESDWWVYLNFINEILLDDLNFDYMFNCLYFIKIQFSI